MSVDALAAHLGDQLPFRLARIVEGTRRSDEASDASVVVGASAFCDGVAGMSMPLSCHAGPTTKASDFSIVVHGTAGDGSEAATRLGLDPGWTVCTQGLGSKQITSFFSPMPERIEFRSMGALKSYLGGTLPAPLDAFFATKRQVSMKLVATFGLPLGGPKTGGVRAMQGSKIGEPEHQCVESNVSSVNSDVQSSFNEWWGRARRRAPHRRAL